MLFFFFSLNFCIRTTNHHDSRSKSCFRKLTSLDRLSLINYMTIGGVGEGQLLCDHNASPRILTVCVVQQYCIR